MRGGFKQNITPTYKTGKGLLLDGAAEKQQDVNPRIRYLDSFVTPSTSSLMARGNSCRAAIRNQVRRTPRSP